MPRPTRCRRICVEPHYKNFSPEEYSSKEKIILAVDEYEVIRLIDLNGLTHEQCSNQMDISRTTVTEIYKSARKKIADAIVNGKSLVIEGGNYRICDGLDIRYCHKTCKKSILKQFLKKKGVHKMKVAITYENGDIFQHFGHTEQFKIYEIENKKIINEKIISTNGQGHGALVDFLLNEKVDALICGGIGGGAQSALSEAGISLFGGAAGNADKAIEDYINGTLVFNPNVHCEHHGHGEHEHSCENHHSCGNH